EACSSTVRAPSVCSVTASAHFCSPWTIGEVSLWEEDISRVVSPPPVKREQAGRVRAAAPAAAPPRSERLVNRDVIVGLLIGRCGRGSCVVTPQWSAAGKFLRA